MREPDGTPAQPARRPRRRAGRRAQARPGAQGSRRRLRGPRQQGRVRAGQDRHRRREVFRGAVRAEGRRQVIVGPFSSVRTLPTATTVKVEQAPRDVGGARRKMNFFLESASIALQAIWANKLRSFLTVLGNIVAVTSIIAVVSLIQGMNAYVTDTIVSGVGADNFTIQRMPVVRTRGRRGARPQQPAHHAGRSGGGARSSATTSAPSPRRRSRRASVSYRHRAGRRRPGPRRVARLHRLLHLRRRARPADQPRRGRRQPPGGRPRLGRRRQAVRPGRSARQDDQDRRAALPGRRRQREEGLRVRQFAGRVRDHPAQRLPASCSARGRSACSCWSSRKSPELVKAAMDDATVALRIERRLRPKRAGQLRHVHVRHVPRHLPHGDQRHLRGAGRRRRRCRWSSAASSS